MQEKRKPTPGFLERSPQILVYDKSFDELHDALLPKNLTANRGQKIFVPDHSTKFKLIEAGVGWGRLSQKEIAEYKEIVPIDKNICLPVHLELSLLRPQRRAIGPIASAIWRVFENRKQN